MESALLSIHVLASIVFVGGSAVATSLFPRYAPIAKQALVTTGAPVAAGEPVAMREPESPGERNPAIAATLHRITRVYSVLGILVPVVGIVLATVQGRMGEIWITVSMILTAVAAGILATQIYPRQRDALATPGPAAALRTLSMLAGAYNLVWAAVVVLMIVRPGSGT